MSNSEATLYIAPRLDAHGGLPSFGGADTASLLVTSVAPDDVLEGGSAKEVVVGKESDDVSVLDAWAGVLADPLRASNSSLAAHRPVTKENKHFFSSFVHLNFSTRLIVH